MVINLLNCLVSKTVLLKNKTLTLTINYRLALGFGDFKMQSVQQSFVLHEFYIGLYDPAHYTTCKQPYYYV